MHHATIVVLRGFDTVTLTPVNDLRFRLDLEAAKLLTKAGNRLVHLIEVDSERTDLLFDSRLRDTDFVGITGEFVEQFCIDGNALTSPWQQVFIMTIRFVRGLALRLGFVGGWHPVQHLRQLLPIVPLESAPN